MRSPQEEIGHDGGPGAVQITAQPGVWWPVQPALFTLAVTNLVENALRYGGSHGPVVVDADTTSGTLVVTVSDSGPGIPEEERERIFERFYRIDRGRSPCHRRVPVSALPSSDTSSECTAEP